MKFVRIITGAVISWLVTSLVQVAMKALLAPAQKRRSLDPKDANALDMVRCPSCGVYTTGVCVNPRCTASH